MNNISSKIVIGLMSGTSVDGIDVCIAKINPDFSFEIIGTDIFEYPIEIKQKIFNLFQSKVDIKELCYLNFVIGDCFASAVLNILDKYKFKASDIDMIGSHGQTIFHLPTDEMFGDYPMSSTLQIGDISVIANRTSILTIGDFRPADIANGGEGAPLVCFADKIIFQHPDISRAIQNIGGIGNVTVISPNCQSFGFDTGPGNMLIDYYMNKFFNVSFDKGGLVSKNGQIDEIWLRKLLNEPYYRIEPPKTTGRELFSKEYAEKILMDAPEKPEDIVATVTALTAKTIAKAYEDFIFPITQINEVVLGGGGAYNPQLVSFLREFLPESIKILRHEDFGVSSCYKEALAFAMLAYATYYKIPSNVPSCTGALKPAILGKVAYPS